MNVERSPLWLAAMLALVLAEAGWRIGRGRGYDGRAALTTLGLVLGNLPFAAMNAAVLSLLFGAVWAAAPIHWSADHWATWAGGFLAVEFAYYWFHRASHRIRWIWASHSVHHSAEQMTLLASLRLGWTNLFSAGWVFYVPLIFAGLPPFVLVALLALNLRYQFFLHTEAVGRLGPIELVFNTPAHHRLHHASNDAYIDKNYGGVLILFDRLFGTLAHEKAGEPIRYGLAHRPATANPLRLAFREWAMMLSDARRARGWRAKAHALLAMPQIRELP
ncbi:sterol desaturase family protein [Sphingobium terrigena]|uniref:Sterol desaturase family protein n=1 Tax=Sphingobium terrigena TaxID=2304063 RepID=A0A418YYA7_9SPHN|nr:sterol desaturase family protein [Sphingobium terrigena]RJG57857.1 sterol desaturase family protein [Sphingobium terrigena]